MKLIREILLVIVGIMLGIMLAQPFSSATTPNNIPFDRASPSNWIPIEDIKLGEDFAKINIPNAQWAKVADTKSMDPVIDGNSIVLQTTPKKEQLNVGDIVSYQPKGENYLIIHRIIAIAEDDQGWYAITKGDNNEQPDPRKVRFEQIKKVVVGIIY
jgi:signal peptidase I